MKKGNVTSGELDTDKSNERMRERKIVTIACNNTREKERYAPLCQKETKKKTNTSTGTINTTNKRKFQQ